VTLTYAYDGFLPTSETSSGNLSGSVNWTYDNDFRATSESVNGGSPVNFTYDADGLLTAAGSLTLARNAQNGLLTGTSLSSSGTTQSYNSFGEVSSFTATQGASTVLGIQYLRDDLGRIIQKTETVGGLTDTYAYGYDAAGRLTLVGKNGSTTASYAYDANGNRLSRTTPSTTETGTYDAQDRLLTYGTKTYAYTANGELLTKTDTATSQTTQYTYDALGNLNTVLLPDGRRIDYLVDGRNRRVAKKVNGAFVQKFLYNDQLRIAAELSPTNAVVSRFVYATRVNVPDYVVKGSTTYRIVTDHLGSPRLVINTSTGAIAQRMDYDEL
jgi:YD repeat-containing protein